MIYEADFLQRLQQVLQLALPQWQMPADAELKLLSISENATYLARDPAQGRHIVIRLQRPDYHSNAEIVSELVWVRALRESGLVHTAEPLRTATGQWLLEIENQGSLYRLTAFSFVAGSEPALNDDLCHWYRILGATNARLHQHSQTWQMPEGFTRKHWNYQTLIGATPHWGDWRLAPGLSSTDIALLEQVQKTLFKLCSNYGQAPSRYGLVHCDLRLANLLVDGEQLCVIDFDDCGFSWYLYDFASCISFIEHDPRVPQFLAAWCEGYLSVAPLAPEDLEMIPNFVMMRRMQLTAWIASHGETPTAQSLIADHYIAGTVALGRAFLQRFQEHAA